MEAYPSWWLPACDCFRLFQVEPLALSAADGMNACIFAYGQTGSGKTHTMIGDARGGEMAGVSYRTMNKLFQVLELRRSQQVIVTTNEFPFHLWVLYLFIEFASLSWGGERKGDLPSSGNLY